jgi:hypothetical protein
MCWLSSDDFFDPRKLEVHRRAIMRWPNTRFFFTYFAMLDDQRRVLLWPHLDRCERQIQVLQMLYRNCVAGNSICVHHSVWNVVEPFDPALAYAQDYDLWLRILVRFPGRFLPERTSIVRSHPQQGTTRFFEATLYDGAKAGIALLQRCSLADLLPLVATRERTRAQYALLMALEVACNPASLIYAIGVHPLLLIRIEEWIAEVADLEQRRRMQYIAHAWMLAGSRLYRRSLFGIMLETAARSVLTGNGPTQDCQISAGDLAEAAYWLRVTNGDVAGAALLQRYLTHFEHRELAASRPLCWDQVWQRVILHPALESGSRDTLGHSRLPNAEVPAWPDLVTERQPTPGFDTFPGAFAVLGCRYPSLLSSARWWKHMFRTTFIGHYTTYAAYQSKWFILDRLWSRVSGGLPARCRQALTALRVRSWNNPGVP